MKWNDPGGAPATTTSCTRRCRRCRRARLLANDGNVDKAPRARRRYLEATYYYPYQLHGSMGPSCAIADVKADEATVWSLTQGVYPLRTAVARVLGFKDQQVHDLQGRPGLLRLNGADTASIDAVLMSKAVGAPVRVQWMRGDEHVWEHYGTPMIMKVKGGLDADGNLVAWDYESRAARGGRPGNVGAANLPTGALIGSRSPEARAGADVPAARSGQLEHGGRLPHGRGGAGAERAGDCEDRRLGVLHRPPRSPARIQNSFANESFIDELAAAAEVDAVTFRLRYVGDERLRT